MPHRVNVTFDDDTYNNLKKISDKKHISCSELIRDYTLEGVKSQVGADNIDLITKIMREQLASLLNPSVERICALSAKTGVIAAQSTFLSAETISKFVDDEYLEDFTDVYNRSKEKAVRFMKIPIADFVKEDLNK